MIRRHLRAAVIALFVTSAAVVFWSHVGAQPLDLSVAQTLGVRSVNRFRTLVREDLTTAEREIERSIEYEVIPTWNANAYATITGSGQRRIQVFAGDMVLMYWLSEATLAPRWGAPPECIVPYITEMMSAIEENSRENRVGGSHRVPVYEFFQYTRRQPSSCRRFSPAAYERDRDGQEQLRALHGRSIHWVLAHELAHHLKGHLTERKPRGSRSEKLEQSRRNEREADLFALGEITRDDPGSAVLAMPAFLLTASLSCSVEDEPEATHPSAEWRWRLLVDSVRVFAESDDDFRRWAQERGVLDRFLASLDQMADAFK
jgi:hypothetical protein